MALLLFCLPLQTRRAVRLAVLCAHVNKYGVIFSILSTLFAKLPAQLLFAWAGESLTVSWFVCS